MWNRNYSEAAVEVLDILDYTNPNDVKRIPTRFIEFLKANSATDYISNLDKTKSIEDLNLRQETRELLGIIYRHWWATEDEKKEIYKKIVEEETKEQEFLNQKYSYDNLFDNKQEEAVINTEGEIEEATDTALIEYKESFFQKIINKIKNFFKL